MLYAAMVHTRESAHRREAYKMELIPVKLPLRKRISPSKCLDAELRGKLSKFNIKIDGGTRLGLSSATISQLEGFLWRDIEYFDSLGISDAEIIRLSLLRLREKTVYSDAVEDLLERFSEENEKV